MGHRGAVSPGIPSSNSGAFLSRYFEFNRCAILKPKKGDSGGPLIQTALVEGTPIEWLVGVVSFGVGCARPGLGGAYSSVDYYSQWIADTVNHFKANYQ